MNQSLTHFFNGMFLAAVITGTAHAASVNQTITSGLTTLSSNIGQTWEQPENVDFYLPAITWHNRWTYDRKHIERFNERPWGAGGGVSRYDAKGNWHGLYLMAFKDSNYKWEPIGGYGWEARWYPLRDSRFHWGTGFATGITARDNWDYIPLPFVFPLASVGYASVDFQMTYIPGTYNNGNVYFAWLRFQF